MNTEQSDGTLRPVPQFDPNTSPDDPLALTIVVRVERGSGMTHQSFVEAVATATLRYFADPRTASLWKHQTVGWRASKIRKFVRRARGARWDAALGVPGVATTVAGVQCHVLPPMARSQVPPEISRLQMAGTNLPRRSALTLGEVLHSPAQPGLAGNITQPPVVIATLPSLSTGKAAVQAAHAVQILAENAPSPVAERWASMQWRTMLLDDTPPAVSTLARMHGSTAIRDAGFTEVAPGTLTAAALFVWC